MKAPLRRLWMEAEATQHHVKKGVSEVRFYSSKSVFCGSSKNNARLTWIKTANLTLLILRPPPSIHHGFDLARRAGRVATVRILAAMTNIWSLFSHTHSTHFNSTSRREPLKNQEGKSQPSSGSIREVPDRSISLRSR